MKIKAARAGHYESGPNMTPLVDVVMVILIFMMLAGRFGGSEHYLVSTTPITKKGAGGKPPPPGFVPDEPLEIRVSSRGSDRYVAIVDGAQASDYEALSAKLTSVRENLARAGKPSEKVQVIIVPTRDARYSHVLDVFQAALNAQFTKVGFSQAR